jgi:hypothetical protein
MADKDRRQLRLILPPGINHAMRQLALKESRSESSMCTRLIAEALDARRVAAAGEPNADLQRLVQILTRAIAPSAPVEHDHSA